MRTVIAVLFAAFVSTAFAAFAADEPRRILPVDEAASDMTWLRFKNRLMEAVRKRDKQYLLSILDPNIRNQTDLTRGITEFRKQWDIDASDTTLWQELGSTLQLGGAFVKRADNRSELCTPYLLAKWPEDLAPFEYGAIIARDSVVQSEPSSSSAPLGTLSYHLVRVLDWELDDKAANAKQKWVRIQFAGRDGYVPEEHVRSPIEHVACFMKTGNTWKMTAFAPAGGE
jgi:hypothetical protein